MVKQVGSCSGRKGSDMRTGSSGVHVEDMCVLSLIEGSCRVTGVAYNMPYVQPPLALEWILAGGRVFSREDDGAHITEDHICARFVPEMIDRYEGI